MSRTLRPHLPGALFHITARTQGRVPLFEPPELSDVIQRIIIEGVVTSDAQYIAHCVMPNHFHILLQQGVRPLGWVMQPIMRRTALLMQRKYGIEGHVFEREYHAKHCETADHARTAFNYTHLNPLRAHLCATLAEYRWSSHTRYVIQDGCAVGIEIVHALRLFGNTGYETDHQLSLRYQRHVGWRRQRDLCDDDTDFEPEPITQSGDNYFRERFSAMQIAARRPVADLRDKAVQILCDVAPELEIDALRRRYLRRSQRDARKQVIAALLQAGYRGKAIADYLRISNSAVSAIASAMRYARLQQT